MDIHNIRKQPKYTNKSPQSRGSLPWCTFCMTLAPIFRITLTLHLNIN